ncbi:cilia- and flagella-associated protein 337-like isoform X2 [Paroedura picta]|uniref:cilia- and flagella-associated protein 337-like isoform X2 n=1 Tax=Paroedura picta TaxID=143630 RepID=UPI004056308E
MLSRPSQQSPACRAKLAHTAAREDEELWLTLGKAQAWLDFFFYTMPLRRKVRPSSASGKLETSTLSSILNELRDSTAATEPLSRRAQTSLGGPRLQAASPVSRSSLSGKAQEEAARFPEWLMKEFIKGQQRSHSIGLMENISESERLHRVSPARSPWKGKIEQQITLDQLQKLHAAFQDLEINGCKYLDIENFKHTVKKCMGSHNVNDEQIETLFMKIDYPATGRIQWNDFCTYIHLEYTGQERSCVRLKGSTFSLPATIQEISHGEPVVSICSLSNSTLITAREDGTISFWSTQLNPKRSKMVFAKTSQKSKWLMDFAIMTPYNKLILGTGDRELQLYEISNFEPYLQINGLEAIPLHVDYCYTNPDECMILYGDDQGCVNILLLQSVGELLRTWNKLPKMEHLPHVSLEHAALSPNVTYIRWKVHGDWVSQLSYYDSMKAIISASSHEPTALVIGCVVGATNIEQQMKEIKEHGKDWKAKKWQANLGAPSSRAEGDQIVFRVHKGVKTFALSKKSNLIVTGGMDRIIRMWNPYMPGRPTGMLRGHMSPVFYVYISEEDNKIFSMSTDNMVKIWDIEDQSCLFTASSKNNGIKGEVSACHYISSTRSLCVATDTLAVLHLRLSSTPDPNMVKSHKEPVLCCKYNKVFRHVVSCSESSEVKVWDFENGKQLFEFGDAHGGSAITCLTFDSSGRRLITGGRDGCLKIWNYNNGHCLHTLKREDRHEEICDCTYVEVNRNKYVIGVGWDRKINMFYDSVDNFHHLQKPQAYWLDDISRGHKEDILCIAQCPPTLLATSSYDGEIIVWNMISGHICRKFHTAILTFSVCAQTEDASVTQVLFLKTRVAKYESATSSLISNGPQGYVHFWTLFSEDPLVASFTPSREKSLISSIAVTVDDSYLYAADEDGCESLESSYKSDSFVSIDWTSKKIMTRLYT